MKKPLVSCLMLTYNRYEPFKKAVQCFIEQTYLNKELVVVNSGNTDYEDKIQSYLREKNISCISIYKNPKESLGELRNLGLQMCSGDYIIVFDDDDIHHPERIEKQIDLCLKSNIHGTLLRNFTAVYKEKEIQCKIIHGLEGTLLFKNPKGVCQYPDINQGEDTSWIKILKQNGYNICVINEDFDLYKYMYHESNTVAEEHFLKMIELNKI